ncbi:hypothetical protein GEMRC1_010675 [Eukaryota sp. GEM-RC1]
MNQMQNGPCVIQSRLQGNWVMGVERAQRGAKVVVQQMRQGDPSQQWIVSPDGTIRNAASNHVIDVERGEIQSPGAGLCLWDAKNPGKNNNQVFQINQNGMICIRANPNMVIDIPQGRAENNKPLATWTAKNPPAQNQTWSLQPAQGGMPQQQFQQQGMHQQGGMHQQHPGMHQQGGMPPQQQFQQPGMHQQPHQQFQQPGMHQQGMHQQGGMPPQQFQQPGMHQQGGMPQHQFQQQPGMHQQGGMPHQQWQ